MCRGDAYMWGEPKTHRSRAKALDLCFTLFYLDLKVSMNKENIVLGWESVLAPRAIRSSGPIRIPILGTIFFGFLPCPYRRGTSYYYITVKSVCV